MDSEDMDDIRSPVQMMKLQSLIAHLPLWPRAVNEGGPQ